MRNIRTYYGSKDLSTVKPDDGADYQACYKPVQVWKSPSNTNQSQMLVYDKQGHPVVVPSRTPMAWPQATYPEIVNFPEEGFTGDAATSIVTPLVANGRGWGEIGTISPKPDYSGAFAVPPYQLKSCSEMFAAPYSFDSSTTKGIDPNYRMDNDSLYAVAPGKFIIRTFTRQPPSYDLNYRFYYTVNNGDSWTDLGLSYPWVENTSSSQAGYASVYTCKNRCYLVNSSLLYPNLLAVTALDQNFNIVGQILIPNSYSITTPFGGITVTYGVVSTFWTTIDPSLAGGYGWVSFTRLMGMSVVGINQNGDLLLQIPHVHTYQGGSTGYITIYIQYVALVSCDGTSLTVLNNDHREDWNSGVTIGLSVDKSTHVLTNPGDFFMKVSRWRITFLPPVYPLWGGWNPTDPVFSGSDVTKNIIVKPASATSFGSSGTMIDLPFSDPWQYGDAANIIMCQSRSDGDDVLVVGGMYYDDPGFVGNPRLHVFVSVDKGITWNMVWWDEDDWIFGKLIPGQTVYTYNRYAILSLHNTINAVGPYGVGVDDQVHFLYDGPLSFQTVGSSSIWSPKLVLYKNRDGKYRASIDYWGVRKEFNWITQTYNDSTEVNLRSNAIDPSYLTKQPPEGD